VTVSHSVFGLLLRSNLHVPGLDAIPFVSGGAIDVDLRLRVRPLIGGDIPSGPETLTYVSSYTSDSGEPALRVWRIAEDFLRLDYFDGMQFWLDRNGSTIWADWPDTLFVEDAATYLLGPVLGIVLRMRGVTCLHASAVAFGNSVAAFVGSAGFGKSTTAAALARHGHSVVSDDIVALVERDGAFFVLPAYPYLCLWPDSVSILFGAEKRLPSFSPTWDKRQLTLSEHRLRFEQKSLPLGAIFLLGERSADPAAPHLESVLPRESLLSLVADSYATNLLDKKMRASEFELLGRLVATVPVQRLRPHKDPSRIDSLCDLIDRTCGGSATAPFSAAV
jgi:hypothetical protein